MKLRAILPFLWISLPYLAVWAGMVLLRNAWGALIGFHLALLPALFLRKQRAPRFFSPVSSRLALAVGLTGLLGGLTLWAAWPWLGLEPRYQGDVRSLGLVSATWLPFIAYFTLVNPFLEEWYWREAFGSESRWPVLSDFLYAGFHLIILALFVGPFWMFVAFVGLSAAGWFWRQVLRQSRSLFPAVFSHMLADLSILLVLYLQTIR
jgi:hypothetical protein